MYNWNGDNAGPFEASEYESRGISSGVTLNAKEIVASTLDNFTQHLVEVRNKLPVVRAEDGDTWIYGVPVILKRSAEWLPLKRCEVRRQTTNRRQILVIEVFLNATRFALKLLEHT